jgi:hypothetical protein
MMALPFYIKKVSQGKKKKSYGNSNQPHRPKPDPETCCCTNGGGACRLFVVQGLQLTSVLLSPQHEFHLIIPKICFSITSTTTHPPIHAIKHFGALKDGDQTKSGVWNLCFVGFSVGPCIYGLLKHTKPGLGIRYLCLKILIPASSFGSGWFLFKT